MLKGLLINIENFSENEKKIIYEIMESFLVDDMSIKSGVYGSYCHSIKKEQQNLNIDKEIEFLLNVTEMVNFYKTEIKPELLNKIVVTDNYFDSIYINMDIKIINLKRQILYGFQENEPILTLIKDEKNDNDKKKRIADLMMKFPHRCKVVNNVNRKEIVEHLLYTFKKIQ